MVAFIVLPNLKTNIQREKPTIIAMTVDTGLYNQLINIQMAIRLVSFLLSFANSYSMPMGDRLLSISCILNDLYRLQNCTPTKD